MPRFCLEESTSGEIYKIAGELPVNGNGLVPVGEYIVDRLDEEPAEDLVVIGGSISVVTPLTMDVLHAGQTIEDTTNFAIKTANANFVSDVPGETIASAQVFPIGPGATDEPVAEGDLVGYSVLVTGTEGTTGAFASPLRATEYGLALVETSGNKVAFDINEAAADTVPISFQLEHPDYTGQTFAFTAAGLRDLATAPFIIPGTARIKYTGAQSALTTGSTLTLVDPAVVTQSGVPATRARQWTRNGADIPGATGQTYDLTASDLGTVVGAKPAATDDLGHTSEVSTATVAIPAGSGLALVTQYSQIGSGSKQMTGIDLSAAASAAPVVITVQALVRGGHEITGLTIDGVAAEVIATNPAGSGRIWNLIVLGTLPADTSDVDFIVETTASNALFEWGVLTVYELSGTPSRKVGSAVRIDSNTTTSATVAALTGDLLIGCGSDDVSGVAVLTGVGSQLNETVSTYSADDDNISGYDLVVSNGDRTVTITNNSASSALAAAVAAFA